MSQPDAIVVGAGAAGLSAARVLQRNGLRVRALEAKNRIGRRAFTDRESFAVPFDHGCTWLSAGDYNPLLKLAMEEDRRMEARFFPTANTKTFLEDRWATEDEENEKNRFLSECERALREAAESGLDAAWTDLIDTKSPWMSYLTGRNQRDGATASASSTLDVARNQGSGELLFVYDGYGSLIETSGEGLPIELEAEVDRIDWSGEGVVIRSSKGDFSSSTAIVTVSTGVLASNQIEFEPALPGRSDARAQLAAPLGDRILFAGEATSKAHYGFAHGAYLEGKAAAERVTAMLSS